MAMLATQMENYEFFKAELPKLLTNFLFKGKFVVIYNKEIVHVSDSVESAMAFALQKYPPNAFNIQQVIDDGQKVEFLCRAM